MAFAVNARAAHCLGQTLGVDGQFDLIFQTFVPIPVLIYIEGSYVYQNDSSSISSCKLYR